MTIDEAIKHCLETAEQLEERANTPYKCEDSELQDNACRECAADHRQLAKWLTELQELELQIKAPWLGSIEEYHYELARCKTAFWSCNKRCMDAEEQYRRKADELRKAQEQIAEYKRLLKVAVKDINFYVDCFEAQCDECCCDHDNHCHWKHEAEALKLIGGSENG